MQWWMWMAGGLLLSVVELLTPGSLFWIFFAAGAVITAVVVSIWPEAGPFAQGTVFVGVSVIALTLFRKPIAEWLGRRSPKSLDIDSLVGETAITLTPIPAGGVGKAELRGTSWNATNSGPALLEQSRRCRVERVDGLMLWIRGEL